jgi:hypothetical protein
MTEVATEYGRESALPAINPDTDNTVNVSVSSAGSTRTSTALSTTSSNLYRFISTVDVYINKGDSSVVSSTTKMLLKANIEYYYVVDKDEYVAGRTDSGSGTLSITPAKKVV